MEKDWVGFAGFSLRIGLGILLLLFGLIKFVNIDILSSSVYPLFYGPPGSWPSLIIAVGIIQIILSFMLFLGWNTTVAAIVGGVFHLFSVLVTLPMIARPFSFPQGMPNMLFLAGIPVLTAFLALAFIGGGKWKLGNDIIGWKKQEDKFFN